MHRISKFESRHVILWVKVMDAQFMHMMQNMHQWYEICINLENTIMNNDIWKCKFVNIEHSSVPATNFQRWNCHTITNLIHIRITFLCLYWLQWKYAKLCKSNIFISVQNFAAALIQTTAACHSQYWSWYMLATTRVRLIMYRIQ